MLAVCATAQPGRLRPPEKLGCAREKLTSFSGTIRSYSRGADRMALRMRTDDDTAERFVLRYRRGEDPAKWFLLRSGTFLTKDWRAIESAPGRLRHGMRATVWVCEGGANPVVDWEPPPK